MDIQKEDSRTISLEYTGKVESVKENKIKYSKELLDKSKNKKEEKSNIVDYNQIKNKKEEKKLVDFNDKSESLENTKEKENDLNKENIKNQVKIKKADDKHLENEGLEEFKVKELQRDSKYRITRKEEKDENKKDMNIIWKIKQMLKGFKRS